MRLKPLDMVTACGAGLAKAESSMMVEFKRTHILTIFVWPGNAGLSQWNLAEVSGPAVNDIHPTREWARLL